jgi:hypothetical protein
MRALQTLVSWIWRLAAAGIAYTFGMVLGGGLATALGLEPATLPEPLDPDTVIPLLVLGGMALALGLAWMAKGLRGSRWRRWAILATFAFVVNGVGTLIEASVFSTLGGEAASTLANFPASLLCALAVVLLFPRSSASEVAGAGGPLFGRRQPASLAARLLLAWFAFPFFYFLFGMIIAPIVTPYYERIDFLVIPPLSVLLSVLFFRSALFLLVSLPIVVHWNGSRGSLALALGLGHFTAVGLSGLIQATFFPAVMRWTHGVEILADSLCYGAALAWLLFAPADERSAVEAPQPSAPGREAAAH